MDYENNFDGGLNYADSEDIPLGLGMALAQDLEAMNYFADLTKSQQQQIIEKTHQINSKQEMQAYVQQLKERGI